MKKSVRYIVCAMAVAALAALAVYAADAPAAKPQTKCPVTGEAINKDKFVDVEGYRVYVCCEGCTAKIKADPKTYLAKIRAGGEEPAKAPAAADAPKCGAVKGGCCGG